MGKTIAQMTEQELRELVGDAVEEKLLELFSDPDQGAEIRPELRSRLLDQQRGVSAGERGRAFDWPGWLLRSGSGRLSSCGWRP